MDQLSPVRLRPRAFASTVPSPTGWARRVIVTGLLVTTPMVALLAASQLINFGVFNLRLSAFDSDYHTSVFGVASLLAQAAVGAASAWRGSSMERHRWTWFCWERSWPVWSSSEP